MESMIRKSNVEVRVEESQRCDQKTLRSDFYLSPGND